METPDATTINELLAVQGILAGVTVALDEVQLSMPPVVCTWRGTARDAYGANLLFLSSQNALLVAAVRDARAAIASALSAVS